MLPFLIIISFSGFVRPRLLSLEMVANLSSPWHFADWISTQGLVYLSSAQIECPKGRVIGSIKFERQMNTFRFVYQCFRMKGDLLYQTLTNDWTVYRGSSESVVGKRGNILLLGLQALDCSDKGFLASIRMEVQLESDMLRYIYSCARKKKKNSDVGQSCQERQTANQEADDFFLPTLVRHSIRCEDDEGLKKFQIRSDARSNLRYNFGCCKRAGKS